MRQAGDVAGTRKVVNDILQLCFEAGAWKTLNEHIVLISKRRGQLKQEAEKHLSDMVVSKTLVAKIDRPMGVVCFQAAKDSNDILNSWAMNLEKLLDLVEKSCHQIHKEMMVHKAALRV
ncbi:26S proteasome non-ATPase regulatory subunit 12 homolog A-like isoform X2 [Primulina tabacum]